MNPAIFISLAMIVFAIGIGTLTSVINSPWIVFFMSPLFFIVLALKDFRIAVFVLVVIVGVGQSRLLPSFSGFNVFNFLILGAMLGLAIKWFTKRQALVMPPRALLLLIVPMSLGLVNGIFNLPTLPAGAELLAGTGNVAALEYAKLLYLRPLLYVLLSLLLANAISNSLRPEKWALPIVISAVVPAFIVIGIVVGFGFDLRSLSSNWNLLGAIGIHKNSLGGLLALGIAPVLFLIPVVKRSSIKILLIICTCTVVAALLLTFSRGGVMAGLAIWILFCIINRYFGLLLLSLLIVPVVFFALPSEIADRLMLGLSEGASGASAARADDELSAGRFWVWEQLLPEIAKRPLIGAGISGHLWAELALISKVSYPHNFLLSTFIDLGIPGGLCVVTFFCILVKGFFRLSKSESLHPTLRALSASGCAMVLGWFVFGLTNSDYIPGKDQIPIWILAGLLFAFWAQAFPRVANLSFYGSARVQQIH